MSSNLTVKKTFTIPRHCSNCGNDWSFSHEISTSRMDSYYTTNEQHFSTMQSEINAAIELVISSSHMKILCPKCHNPALQIMKKHFNKGINAGLLEHIEKPPSAGVENEAEYEIAVFAMVFVCFPAFFFAPDMTIKYGALLLGCMGLVACIVLINKKIKRGKCKPKVKAWLETITEDEALKAFISTVPEDNGVALDGSLILKLNKYINRNLLIYKKDC